MRLILTFVVLAILFSCIEEQTPNFANLTLDIKNNQARKLLLLNVPVPGAVDSVSTFYKISTAESVNLKAKIESIIHASENQELIEKSINEESEIGMNAYFEEDQNNSSEKYFVFGYKNNDKGIHVRWNVKNKKPHFYLNRNKAYIANGDLGEEVMISKEHLIDILKSFAELEVKRNNMTNK